MGKIVTAAKEIHDIPAYSVGALEMSLTSHMNKAPQMAQQREDLPRPSLRKRRSMHTCTHMCSGCARLLTVQHCSKLHLSIWTGRCHTENEDFCFWGRYKSGFQAVIKQAASATSTKSGDAALEVDLLAKARIASRRLERAHL